MATFFALASAAGRAGVAVVRLSGPSAGIVFRRLCQPALVPVARQATLRALVHPKSGAVIDRALVLWFPAPHSFTGEDVVELHVHGGRAVLQALFDALSTLPDFAPAPAGAFTRRAFENGKLDLTEAEAIADLVDAETEAQRRQALRQLDGALGKLYRGWAQALTEVLAFLEATIDFADEDLPPELADDQETVLTRLVEEISAHLDDRQRGERLRDGFTVALIGAPNVGKSCLLNALAGREAAIVTPHPGTTRDVIEVALDLRGWPVLLADTAGLRTTTDLIEQEGVKRALAKAADADVTLLVIDGTLPLRQEDLDKIDARTIVVVNKSDLMTLPSPYEKAILVSATRGSGLDLLMEALVDRLETMYGLLEQPSLTRARHRTALETCRASLTRALGTQEIDLKVEDVRLALRALGRITGTVDVEDLLDLVFSRFCIGK
jgi:tRNA modification GTPase